LAKGTTDERSLTEIEDGLAYTDRKYDYLTALEARAVPWARDLH
jgi:hypothetical protein